MKAAGESEKKEEPKQETSLWDSDKPKPTRRELFETTYKLGIDTTGKETVDQLIAKIKAF